jgi:DNA-3-methyladenine glycosylase II
LTTRKAEYIVALATAVATETLDLAALRERPDAEVLACLMACRGLGRWTAEWFLARALGRPRVVAGDLGVRKAVGAAYCNGHLPSETEVRELTAHWGAAAGVAQQLLLHGLSHGYL